MGFSLLESFIEDVANVSFFPFGVFFSMKFPHLLFCLMGSCYVFVMNC